MNAWEYWCHGPNGARWSKEPTNPVALFSDGAPELTVSRVRGFEGYVTVYTPIVYGAKAHPELSERDGRLFITYCRNLGDLADHARMP